VSWNLDENHCQKQLADRSIDELLARVDAELAEAHRQEGCRHCDGRLHQADFPRKPRGGPAWDRRRSFCCDQDGCRRRHTPPSVRFLGRRVYPGLVVVLVSALRHGLTPSRLRRLRETLGVDRRTVERWRRWWLQRFVDSPFWKEARARFLPPVTETHLPACLGERFGGWARDQLVNLLRFLAPLTSVSGPKDRGM
jgi:hypothetical protein